MSPASPKTSQVEAPASPKVASELTLHFRQAEGSGEQIPLQQPCHMQDRARRKKMTSGPVCREAMPDLSKMSVGKMLPHGCCDSSTQRWKQEGSELELSLGYIASWATLANKPK